MAKKRIQVILVETFKGDKYLFRLDREYEQALTKLLKGLIKTAKLGSIACLSLRYVEEDKYEEIPKSADFVRKENKDGKENSKTEETASTRR